MQSISPFMIKQTDAYEEHLLEGANQEEYLPPNKRYIHASAKYLCRPQRGATDDDLIKGGGEQWMDLGVDQRIALWSDCQLVLARIVAFFVLGVERP